MNNRKQKKLKRETITLETKIEILNRLADGEGSTAIGREFKLGESTIRSIQKRASKINESYKCAANKSGKRVSYSRNILIEKTEKALLFWIKGLNRKGIPNDGELIKEKAMYYFHRIKDSEPSSSSSHYKNPKFSASNGWLSGFLRRHTLRNVKIQDKVAFPDETTSKKCCEVPKRTFIAKSKKTSSGIKDDPLSDSDFYNLTNNEDGQKEPNYMTADQMYAGIQLCSELEAYFLKYDNNSKRSLKFRNVLRTGISVYCDAYKQLTKVPPSQKLITSYMVKKTRSNQISSSDEE